VDLSTVKIDLWSSEQHITQPGSYRKGQVTRDK